MITVDVVILSYEGYTKTKKLIESFKNQINVNVGNIIIPITRSYFGNDYNLKKYCDKNSIIYFFVDKKDFSHSLVRERAIINYCKNNIVILMTQDAELYNVDSMYNLVKDIYSKEVVYTFGRQLCLRSTGIEKYIRDYNYPSINYIASKDKISKYQIKAFFASDVFAGLDRNIFIKLNGYGIDVSTNEDMLYMYKIFASNFRAKYCCDAMVVHFHKYSLRELYKRYYEIGKFFKKTKVFNNYKKNKSAKDLALYVLRESFKKIDILSLISFLPNMLARYFGMKNGLK